MSANGKVDSTEKSTLDPEIGMVFYSEEQAYNLYNSYAKRKGFSVRKDHLSRRKDGTIRYRHYVCSNEGTREDPACHVSTRKFRSIERTNCMARIEFKVSSNNEWVVNKFIDEHNHPLMGPHNSHMLRSHRKQLNISKENFEDCVENSRLVPTNQLDLLNTKRGRELNKGEAQFILEFFKYKKSKDPNFFYAVQLDKMDRLTNCFWADLQSILDYYCFGDAVTLDTSYNLNQNEIPLALFIGTNHHKEITIFGSAILLDESVESYLWLFRTFLSVMNGNQPKTIFTDQNAPITKAIVIVLPDSCQRYSLWHIIQNIRMNLPNLCIDEFEKLVYDVNLEGDFNLVWENLVLNYDLAGNSLLIDLYSNKEKWASAYPTNSFCSIMTTKEWYQNMEKLFNVYFCRKAPLDKLITQYLKSLVRLRDKEILEDYESGLNKIDLFAEIPLLIEACGSYTRVIYLDFEQEYKSQLACICEPMGTTNGTIYTYKVYNSKNNNNNSIGIVDFDPTVISVNCSCRKFDCMGILCMHSLKVLINNNILSLPNKYLMKRWTKCAKDRIRVLHGFRGKSDYARVCRNAVFVALKSSVSKDALDLLENGLDKFIKEMESFVNNSASLDRQELGE